MARTMRTVRELIFWEYAKLIAGSAVGDRKGYGFVVTVFNRLMAGQISVSAVLRENKQLFMAGEECAYCGSKHGLQWEHIIPKTAGGPDTMDNLVRACTSCNQTKACLDPYQWYELRGAIDDIPRIVLGKFLKLVLAEYERLGVLDSEEYMHDRNIRRVTLSQVFRREPDDSTDSKFDGQSNESGR